MELQTSVTFVPDILLLEESHLELRGLDTVCEMFPEFGHLALIICLNI